MTEVVPATDNEDDRRRAVWQAIKADLRADHGEDIYVSWFEKLDFEGGPDATVILSTPTAFIRHWNKQHYGTDILRRWQAVDAETRDVQFVVRSSLSRKKPTPSAKAPHRQGAVPTAVAAPKRHMDGPPAAPNAVAGLEGSRLEPRFTFDRFVEGPSNALAVAAGKKVAFAQPGERAQYNPICVVAPVGLGKTHLLQAIAQSATHNNPSRRVLYITSEHFMYRFIAAMRDKNTLSFKDFLRDIDVLLIDDLQFLNGQRVHEEFGHTLTTLVDSQRQVVIAADRAPAELDGLEARVRSRLGGGLVVELDAPDYAMRRKILEIRIEAQREVFAQLNFPEEVVDFVARSVTTNGRDLDGAVNRLVAHNQLTGQDISIAMAEGALRDLLRARESRRTKIEDIQRVACVHYGVSKQDLVSARRTRTIVEPRQVAMYLCKTQTPRSLPEIGRRFGNRDHTTVLHAVRKIEKQLQTDHKLAEDIETLKRLLEQ